MTSPVEHTDVGAYALGVLDPAETARFEEHLAGCEWCAAELESLMGLPPLLAEQADYARQGAGRNGQGLPRSGVAGAEALGGKPGPEVLKGLLAETAVDRRKRRSRRLYAIAAALAAVVLGPVATVAVTGGGSDAPAPVNAAASTRATYDHGEKFSAEDAHTKARAGVSMERKPWGTQVVMRLGHIRGPLKCKLVAVSDGGEQQTVTTWSVPKGGYDIEGARWTEPLYANGGAAFKRDEIARFEVRTLDGERLASVKV